MISISRIVIFFLWTTTVLQLVTLMQTMGKKHPYSITNTRSWSRVTRLGVVLGILVLQSDTMVHPVPRIRSHKSRSVPLRHSKYNDQRPACCSLPRYRSFGTWWRLMSKEMNKDVTITREVVYSRYSTFMTLYHGGLSIVARELHTWGLVRRIMFTEKIFEFTVWV